MYKKENKTPEKLWKKNQPTVKVDLEYEALILKFPATKLK